MRSGCCVLGGINISVNRVGRNDEVVWEEGVGERVEKEVVEGRSCHFQVGECRYHKIQAS